MEIKVAEHSGFCFGVKRAINIAEKTLACNKNKKCKIYSLGAIIHNPQVVDELSRKGLEVIKNIDTVKKGTVIISSHGASKDVIGKIRKKKLKLVDATCPFVKYAHDIVKKLKKEGYNIIIAGDREHVEVKALMSLAGKGEGRKIAVVSQTTQNKDAYIKRILDVLNNDFEEVRIFNTICKDTARRQNIAHDLLKDCDVMIVIGGKNSANTRRLWQICKERGVDTYHIEAESELNKRCFKGKKRAGIVSGASTPENMVKKVVEKIKEITKKIKGEI
jgi:(E)-4-hydroxy-3-methyl-but-2-enyl pyrophosphate reductase